jgi:hypothetical protein
MDREVVALAVAALAVRVALMPPEQCELVVRGMLLGAARLCRAAAWAAGSAGLRLECAYQVRAEL